MDWKKLGLIASGIDGGCIYCIDWFSESLLKNFPDMDQDAYCEGLGYDPFTKDADGQPEGH